MPTSSQISFFLCFLISLCFTDGTQLIIVNNCQETIWPGILGGAGHPTPNSGGFNLSSGEQISLQVPNNWSGRIWGRQGCCFNPQTGEGSCQTGDCAGLLNCNGIAGNPPATVVEITLSTPKSSLHYYDVSLVDGFNLPVSMKPIGGGGGSGGGCGVAGCEVDLNVFCPAALVVEKEGKIVGCKSACLATKSEKYCCTGEFGNPQSCKPSVFARLFKAVCPRSFSYAFDDSKALNKCRASRYVISFCPV
ncbi:hypothetical protein UlMin_025613 [Ulmus minor]